MGNGITQISAAAGINVNMVDVSEELLSKCAPPSPVSTCPSPLHRIDIYQPCPLGSSLTLKP